MRVISGLARGRRLEAPPDSAVRPMLDRVKESLFSILQTRLEGARVLDLFCGTGALGIEALSRGAASCLLIESEPALVACARRNLEKTGLAARARVVRASVLGPPPAEAAPERFSLVLCDPPYRMVSDPVERTALCEAIDRWVEAGRFAPDVVLMLHHAPPATILWSFRRLEVFDARQYGRSVLSFFRLATAPSEE